MKKMLFGILFAAIVANAGYKCGGSSSFHSSSFSSGSSSRSSSFSSSKPSFSSGSSYKSSSYSSPRTSSYTAPKQSNTNTVRYGTSGTVGGSGYKTTSTASTYKTNSQYKTSTPTASNTRSYSSYNTPISRRPNWYSNNYHFHFNNSYYNRGYNYYPIYADPWTGNLLAMSAGALVTYMILENGSRQPIYADGSGAAYAMVNGNRVLVAQDDNGNWAQLSSTANDVGPSQVAPTTVVVNQKSPFPYVTFFIIMGAIVFLACLGYFIFGGRY